MGRLVSILMLLVAFGGIGSAQTSAASQALGNIPSCALPCLITAIQASPCNITDTECQCTNAELERNATVCIIGSCAVEDALVAKNVTQTMCEAPIRDQAAESNIIYITLMSIASVVVFVRLGYKKSTTGELGLDDWFILSTVFIGIPSAVVNVVGLSGNGLGRDIWTLSPTMITQLAKSFYVVSILYFAEVSLLKLSILFFYIKIFPGQGIRRLLYGTVVFNALFGITFVVMAIFQCRPISYNWTSWKGEGNGTCINLNGVAWSNAGISITLDLWMLALPMSQLRQLKMHWKKKIGVALMFCVGTFVTVVSVIRVNALVQFSTSTNLSWDYWYLTVWSSVEITVGIICACMPSMRVILVRIAPSIFGSSRNNRSGYYKKSNSENKANVEGHSDHSKNHNFWRQKFIKKPTINSTNHSSRVDSPEEALFHKSVSDIANSDSIEQQSVPLDDLNRPNSTSRRIMVSTQVSVHMHQLSDRLSLDRYRWKEFGHNKY